VRNRYRIDNTIIVFFAGICRSPLLELNHQKSELFYCSSKSDHLPPVPLRKTSPHDQPSNSHQHHWRRRVPEVHKKESDGGDDRDAGEMGRREGGDLIPLHGRPLPRRPRGRRRSAPPASPGSRFARAQPSMRRSRRRSPGVFSGAPP